MSDLSRLRELAALLRPAVVVEARVKSRTDLDAKFKALEEGVADAIKDLMFELGEGGALETMMDDVGVSDHKDAQHIIKGVQDAAAKLQKDVGSLLMEAEGLLFSAMKESIQPDPVNEETYGSMKAWEQAVKAKHGDVSFSRDRDLTMAVAKDADGKEVGRFDAQKGRETGNGTITEMAKATEYRGGAFDRKRAKLMIQSFKDGEDTFDLENGEKYRAAGKISGGALKKGDVVFAIHDQYNTGAELYQVLGFGKDDKIKYDSVKAAYAGTGTKTLKGLEEFNDKNEKDEVRLIVKDLNDGDEGDFFYIFQGRWAYGSGAEALTFIKVEKV